jgi:hypothetical protein
MNVATIKSLDLLSALAALEQAELTCFTLGATLEILTRKKLPTEVAVLSPLINHVDCFIVCDHLVGAVVGIALV